MQEDKFEPELLRPVEFAMYPDPRSTCFVKFDREVGKMRPLELADHFAAVYELRLHPGVPESVVIQFETAKNLYLYAWFVYRFFAVAEHQSLASLEFALRDRFGEEIKKKGGGRGHRPGLQRLLEYARDGRHIRNEGFSRWHERVATRARSRYMNEKLEERNAKGLDTIILDYSEVVITDQDRDWDYIGILVQVLPRIRNLYAHGSSTIHNQVRGTLELTMEIINQVFPDPSTTG